MQPITYLIDLTMNSYISSLLTYLSLIWSFSTYMRSTLVKMRLMNEKRGKIWVPRLALKSLQIMNRQGWLTFYVLGHFLKFPTSSWTVYTVYSMRFIYLCKLKNWPHPLSSLLPSCLRKLWMPLESWFSTFAWGVLPTMRKNKDALLWNWNFKGQN